MQCGVSLIVTRTARDNLAEASSHANNTAQTTFVG
jgi:hypothetical protein